MHFVPYGGLLLQMCRIYYKGDASPLFPVVLSALPLLFGFSGRRLFCCFGFNAFYNHLWGNSLCFCIALSHQAVISICHCNFKGFLYPVNGLYWCSTVFFQLLIFFFNLFEKLSGMMMISLSKSIVTRMFDTPPCRNKNVQICQFRQNLYILLYIFYIYSQHFFVNLLRFLRIPLDLIRIHPNIMELA